MKTSRVVQLVIAGALAAGLNGLAAAQPIHLSASATNRVASISTPSSLFVNSTDALMPVPSALGNFHHGDFGNNHSQCPAVPEPSVYFLMLAGVGLIGFMSYRRHRNLMPGGQALSSV